MHCRSGGGALVSSKQMQAPFLTLSAALDTFLVSLLCRDILDLKFSHGGAETRGVVSETEDTEAISDRIRLKLKTADQPTWLTRTLPGKKRVSSLAGQTLTQGEKVWGHSHSKVVQSCRKKSGNLCG